MNASTLLVNLKGEVERHSQTVQQLIPLSEEVLNKPAVDGGWSIAQCLEHLNRYGYFYLPEISKGISSNLKDKQVAPEFHSSWLGAWFTKILDPKRGKKKLKAFKKYIPPQQLNAHDVLNTFLHQQTQLKELLTQADNVDLNRVKISVSISPFVKLKLGDVFQFFIAHNERHLLQALRNVKKGSAQYSIDSL
jgi:uncharacterized damage-inducible protein DinB